MAKWLKAKPRLSAQFIMLAFHAECGDFGAAAFIKGEHLRVCITTKLKS